MADFRLSTLFRKIGGSRRETPDEPDESANNNEEASFEGPTADLGTESGPSGNLASELGVSKTSGNSIMRRFAYAVAVVAAAAIGYALGDGISLLLDAPVDELDPNSEIGLELGRLEGEINVLRQEVESLAIPDPASEKTAELQRQSFEQRIGDMESDLEAISKSRNFDASRFEALSKADEELSKIVEEQAKMADASAAELDSISGNLQSLISLRDDVLEIGNRVDNLASAAPDAPALTSELEAIGSRLSAIERSPDAISKDVEEEVNWSTEIELLLANDRELESKLDGLQSGIAGLLSVPGEIEKIRARIREVETDVDALAGTAAEVPESKLISAFDQKSRALEEELMRIKEQSASEFAVVRQEIDALDSEFRSALDSAASRITYSRVFDAIYSGRSYSAFLDEIDWVQPKESETLAQYAELGVKSLEELEDLFLRSARETLKSSQAGSDSEQGVTSFLKSLVVVRSLSPQEGNDVGSVLSRAEAALNDGRLRASLELVSSLPESSRQSMKDWSDAATSRLAVLDAISMSSTPPSLEPQE